MANAGFSLSSTVSGLPEQSTGSSAAFVTTFQTTQAVGSWSNVTAETGVSSAASVSIPSSCSVVYLKARDSTNPSPFRFAFSTADTGVPISSQFPSLIGIATGIHTSAKIWTTASTAVAVRVGLF